MKKLLILLFGLLLATGACAVPLGQGLGDYFPAGITVEGGGMTGSIEGYSIDVVQASDKNIVDNDTLDLVFAFEPANIVLYWSSKVDHDTTNEPGITVGQTLITVTAVNTISINANNTYAYENAGLGEWDVGEIQNDTTNTIYALGGNDGTDSGQVLGTSTWTTATKTLQITFQESNTDTAKSFIDIMAVGYR